jgi:hypothetical protein
VAASPEPPHAATNPDELAIMTWSARRRESVGIVVLDPIWIGSLHYMADHQSAGVELLVLVELIEPVRPASP